MLILTPSTVYAEELVNMPAFSIIQPITGAALANENLTDSLTARLNLYLVDNYTNGNIDEQKFNEIVASGMISENAFFANSVFVGDSLTVGFKEYCRTHESIASVSKMSSQSMPALCQYTTDRFSILKILYHSFQMSQKCLSATE